MKFFKLSFHVEGSSKSRSLRLPEFSKRVLCAGKALVLLGILLLVVQVGVQFSYGFLKNRMISHRIALSDRLSREQVRLDSLNRMMESRFANEDLLHYKFGLNPPDRSSREMSIGGPESPERRLSRVAQPILDQSLLLKAKVNSFARRLWKTKETLGKLLASRGSSMRTGGTSLRFLRQLGVTLRLLDIAFIRLRVKSERCTTAWISPTAAGLRFTRRLTGW